MTKQSIVKFLGNAENKLTPETNNSGPNIKSTNSINLKSISISALSNLAELNRLGRQLSTDAKKKPMKIKQKSGQIKPIIKPKVDLTDNDSDVVRNIKQIIQEKCDLTGDDCDLTGDVGDFVKDIKPIIQLKDIGDVTQNNKPTIHQDVDLSDDSDMEIEEIKIVAKTNDPQVLNFPASQDVFVETIMNQVEDLESTLGSQIKQKDEELLKERELIELLKMKNSILENKEQEKKLEGEKLENKTIELSKILTQKENEMDILNQKNKLKEQERKLEKVKNEDKIIDLIKTLTKKENEMLILNENVKVLKEERKLEKEKNKFEANEFSKILSQKEKIIDLKEEESKLAAEKHKNKTSELSKKYNILYKKVTQKEDELKMLNKKFSKVSEEFKILKKSSDKQVKTEKESMKKIIEENMSKTTTFNKKISIFEKSTKESNDTIAKLNKTNVSLNKKLVKKDHLISEMKLNISKLTSEFTKGYKDRDNQLESNFKEIQEITSKNDNLLTKVSAIEKDVATKNKEVTNLKKDNAQKDKKIMALEQELDTKDTELSTKTLMNSRQATLIGDLSKNVSTLEKDVSLKQQKIFILEKDFVAKVDELATKNTMNNRQASILGELSKNLEDLSNSKNDLEKIHVLTTKQHNELTNRFENLQECYQQTFFIKKHLQDKLYTIKTLRANNKNLEDEDIFEDKLEQALYNSKREAKIEGPLMLTYNWPVLSIEVDSRIWKDSKKEVKKKAFKQFHIETVSLMLTYLWPVVPFHIKTGAVNPVCKTSKRKIEEDFVSNKRPRLSGETNIMFPYFSLFEETLVDRSNDSLNLFTKNWPMVKYEPYSKLNLKRKQIDKPKENKKIKINEEIIEKVEMFAIEILEQIIACFD